MRKGSASGPKFAEFFAGIGLVRLALEESGWTLAFANDIDPDKREMYDGHFKDAAEHFDTTDIHLLSTDRIPTVELATASFPCTDLSLAGGRLGFKGRHSSTFWGFMRVIEGMKERKPPLILIENVFGFLTSHGGSDFSSAMKSLNDLGYYVDPFILDAKWFVPQSRVRLFIVACNQDLPQYSTTRTASHIRPAQLTDFIQKHPDIQWRLFDPLTPPVNSSIKLKNIIENLDSDHPAWWSKERAEYLYNQMSDRHKAIADRMIEKHTWSYGTVFRRVRKQSDGSKRSMAELRTDGIAGCLRTPRGGSGRQILFKGGYGRFAARLLTPRECARLMGADDFEIVTPNNQALFGFGDAVCVPAVKWIADHYLNPALAEIKKSSSMRKAIGA